MVSIITEGDWPCERKLVNMPVGCDQFENDLSAEAGLDVAVVVFRGRNLFGSLVKQDALHES